MDNTEYSNNILFKIFYDSRSNTLALLKGKFDCSLYLIFIDLDTNKTSTISIDGLFAANKGFRVHNDDLAIENSYYYAFENLKKRYKNDFIIIDSFQTFEVDFTNGIILLETTNWGYKFDHHSKKESHNVFSANYIILDLEGRILFEGKINKDSNHNNEGINVFKLLDIQTFVFLTNYDTVFHFLNFFKKESTKCLLINHDEESDEEGHEVEFWYEYIGSYDINKKANLIGFVFQNPTYGEGCIKLFSINKQHSFTFIDKYVFPDDIFMVRFIAFNFNGNEFVTLGAILEGQKVVDYQIRIYNLEKTKDFKKIFNIGLISSSDWITHITYYSENIICVVTNSKFMLIELTSGKKVATILRDPTIHGVNKDYTISDQKIFHIIDKKLNIYDIKESELLKLI